MQTSGHAVAGNDDTHALRATLDDTLRRKPPPLLLTSCTQILGHSSVSEGSLQPSGEQQGYTFDITHEEVVKKRYLTLYNRRIRFPAHADKPVMALPVLCTCLLHAIGPMLCQRHFQGPGKWCRAPLKAEAYTFEWAEARGRLYFT